MKKIVPVNASLIPDGAERVFKGTIFDVYHWQQEMFDGSFDTFEMLRRPDAVAVVAIRDGKLVVVHEQQPNNTPWYAIPAGRHDVPGETHLEAAQRELAEEAGMEFTSWRLIDVNQPVEKIEWFVYVYIATDFKREVPLAHEKGEKINVHLMDLVDYHGLKGKERMRFWSQHLEDAESVDELLALPEFKGKEIER
jgi:ADP-ribose pyrophosphatase